MVEFEKFGDDVLRSKFFDSPAVIENRIACKAVDEDVKDLRRASAVIF